jgi:predicted AAA+ superfamily ATPase
MVNLLKHNLHWREGFSYGFEKKRDLYHKLIEYLDTEQVLGIVGLRRTGKTVLLKQVMDHLIERGVDRQRIVYFSYDEEQPEIESLLMDYQSRVVQAYFEAIKERPWVTGFFLFGYEYEERPLAVEWSARGKPAEDVWRKWNRVIYK